MAKSFKDVVQDSPRTGLGIPVPTKTPSFEPILTFRTKICIWNLI